MRGVVPLADALDAQTVGLIVSLLVSIAALGISAASLWHSALRPAEITFDHLPSRQDVAGGGTHDIPTVHRLQLTFAVSNAGARAGLLIAVKVDRVNPVGAPELGGEAAGPPESPHGPLIVEVGVGEISFPRTVEAGDVRSYGIKFELDGALRAAVGTLHALEPPDREPLARMLAKLERVEVVISWRYRRSVGLFHRQRDARSGALTVSIPGERLREPAVAFWEGPHADRPDLAGIVRKRDP